MTEMELPPTPDKDPSQAQGRFVLTLAVGAGYGVLLRLVFALITPIESALPHGSGAMLASFLFLTPFIVGMLTIYIERARMTLGRSVVMPWLPMTLVLLIAALTGIEGSICILLAAPIFLVASSIGGMIMYGVLQLFVPRQRHFSMVLLLPLILGLGERQLPLPDAQRVSVASTYIDATPASIWHLINDATDIRPAEMSTGLAWRIGVPYPVKAVTVDTPAGRVRKLQWQHGVHFDEPILAWDENRFIRWSYRFGPDSIPAGALDEHVRIGGKYFDLTDTSYRLEPEGDGTRLSIRVSYRVTTAFNWYAAPLAELLVSNAAGTILHFYKVRSEAAAGDARPAVASIMAQ